MSTEHLQDSPLGKNSEYPAEYDPAQLCPLPRSSSWQSYGHDRAPWVGVDIWNAWEISWLNRNGLPRVAVGEFRIPADSASLIESKSLKLYLNSFSQTQFDSIEEVERIIAGDLTNCATTEVDVNLCTLDKLDRPFETLQGHCIDNLNVSIEGYGRNAGLLKLKDSFEVQETLYSHLLKTNCPVTGQPDWGSVVIEYRGKQIQREGMLKYIVSYRGECDFHEQCTETIFLDIMEQCQPDELTVYTRYLRRGGLDINPWRSNAGRTLDNTRFTRQ